MTTEDENLRPNLTLFGRKLTDIPCYRSTFLYGTGVGFGSMMTYFLFTSNIRKAVTVGTAVFSGFSFTYWCYCRYNYSLEKFNYARLQEAMKIHHLKDMDDRDR